MSVWKAKKLRRDPGKSAGRPVVWALIPTFIWGLGCNQRAASTPPERPAAALPEVAPAAPNPSVRPPPAPRTGATVTGRVTAVGKLPPPLVQPRGSDPFCAQKELADDSLVVAGQGGVRSVLVRIVEAAGGPYAPPTEPVTLTQADCRYRPRVLGAVRGQPVLVGNADGTLHNVHALLGDTTLLNQVQVDAQAPPIDLQRVLQKVDAAASGPAITPLKLRCDVHPWMSAYLFVLEHPFFAITSEDGSFTLHNVPAGEYTLQAWHERLGTQLAKLRVSSPADAAKPPRVEFRFTLDATPPPLSPPPKRP